MTANEARKRTEEARKRSYWLFDEVMVAVEKAANDGNYQTSVEIYTSFQEDLDQLLEELKEDGYKVNYLPQYNELKVDWA